jgi:hypothetical protein
MGMKMRTMLRTYSLEVKALVGHIEPERETQNTHCVYRRCHELRPTARTIHFTTQSGGLPSGAVIVKDHLEMSTSGRSKGGVWGSRLNLGCWELREFSLLLAVDGRPQASDVSTIMSGPRHWDYGSPDWGDSHTFP